MPVGTHPMLFQESSCLCIQSYMPVVPLFYLPKVPFLACIKRVGAILAELKCSPGDTDFLNNQPTNQ